MLYASQSGTSEGQARKLAKELKAQGHVPAISTLVGYTPAALAAEKYALIFASTYGDGDAPDGVQPFYEQFCLEHFPRFEGLSDAVFALGDKHYEHFCKFGNDLDTKLAALGANRLSLWAGDACGVIPQNDLNLVVAFGKLVWPTLGTLGLRG